MTSHPHDGPRRHRQLHRALLVLPFVWQLALAPVVNGVRLRLFGLPFAMLWQMAGVVLASAAIAIVFQLDAREAPADEEAR